MEILEDEIGKGIEIDMNESLKKVYYFHTGFVMDLFGVSRKTIYRWIENETLPSFQADNRKHLFSLESINNKLASLGYSALTKDEAHKMWENYK